MQKEQPLAKRGDDIPAISDACAPTIDGDYFAE